MKNEEYKIYKDLQDKNLKSWWEKLDNKNISKQNEGIWHQIRNEKPTTRKDVDNFFKNINGSLAQSVEHSSDTREAEGAEPS